MYRFILTTILAVGLLLVASVAHAQITLPGGKGTQAPPLKTNLSIPKPDLRISGAYAGTTSSLKACNNTLTVTPTTPGVTKNGSKYNVTFYWLVKLTGSLPSSLPNGKVHYIISPATYAPNDMSFNGSNKEYSIKNTVSNLSAGTPVTLILTVDDKNKIIESNESNNTCTIRIQVQE